MPHVYVLTEIKTGKHYIGSCENLSIRLNRHFKHTGGRTTSTGEWVLLCEKEFEVIDEARRVERLLKSYKGGNSFRKTIEEWRRG